MALAVLPAASAQIAAPALDAALTPARAAVNSGQWATAEQQLQRYLRDHQNSAEALYLLGFTLFHENKPQDSLAAYTRAAKSATPAAHDLRTVALDYVLLNDYADADRWVTRAVADDPSDADTWYDMGRIKYTENRFAEAVDSFGQALRLTPRSVKAQNNLGLAYEGLNRPDDAVKAYRQAIAWGVGSSHPSEQPLLNLGMLLTDRNQLDEALTLLTQAETIAPGDSKIHGALGKLHVHRGEYPQAQAELERAVAADPANAGLHFQLGQVYRKLGFLDRAAAELKQASEAESKTRR